MRAPRAPVIHELDAGQAPSPRGRALPSGRREAFGIAAGDLSEHAERTVDLGRHVPFGKRSQAIVPVDVVVAVDAELVSLGHHSPKEIGKRAGDLGTREQRSGESGAKTVEAASAASKHLSREALLGEETPDGPSRIVGAHRHVDARREPAPAEKVEEKWEADAKAAVGVDVDLEG